MLLCLSIDHRGGSFPLLERLARLDEASVVALAGPGGSVLLSTCNRFELYAETAAEAGDAVTRLLDELAASSGIPARELRAAAVISEGFGAVEHLFSVAAGLESAVVGEEEIAGQVRRAHTRARELGSVTHQLERLFQAATRTARTVAQRTELRSAGRSLVRLALRIAESRIPSWPEARIVLVGTGAYAGATVSALKARGAQRIRAYSPSGRAAGFAAERGIEAVAPSALREALDGADLVIACSRAEEPLLATEHFAPNHPERRLLIDLGMPRNIEPEVAALPGLELLDLETVVKHAPVSALGVRAEAVEIVRAAAEEFVAAQAERDALPALLSLRGHVLGILDEELCRARRRASGEARESGDARAEDPVADEVEAALRRLVGRLLHDPTTRIRALGRAGRSETARDAVSALFGL